MGFAEELVAAPRGRRSCVSALAGREVLRPDEVGELVERDLGTPGDRELLAALASSVDVAMYWEEPDAVDQALADPGIGPRLLPVARAIASAPAARWWSSGIDLDAQVHVEMERTTPPTDRPGAEIVSRWRDEAVEDERRSRQRPSDPSANFSGHWWSAPPRELITTTRARPAALGLCLEEDSFGPEWAWCRSVRATREPRVLEITGPEAWCEIVERYPLEVTLSRRHDWWRVTGWVGRWHIPDWNAVAADHDAVHLTCAGYLTTAGRALPVGEARTMLAGWDPDQTYWFSDDLDVGEPAFWRGEPEDLETWAPADPDEVLPEPPPPPPRPRGWRWRFRGFRKRPGQASAYRKG